MRLYLRVARRRAGQNRLIQRSFAAGCVHASAGGSPSMKTRPKDSRETAPQALHASLPPRKAQLPAKCAGALPERSRCASPERAVPRSPAARALATERTHWFAPTTWNWAPSSTKPAPTRATKPRGSAPTEAARQASKSVAASGARCPPPRQAGDILRADSTAEGVQEAGRGRECSHRSATAHARSVQRRRSAATRTRRRSAQAKRAIAHACYSLLSVVCAGPAQRGSGTSLHRRRSVVASVHVGVLIGSLDVEREVELLVAAHV